eukprot:gb/GECH01014731.1/.p1 GENE.gb/GECH01014731.1/~~gb/GECH01014731.1/.p1  ORF type:complete len:463 (+),score=153.02 gb/GECH01014731.1/:1-1389(+)
MSLHMSRMSIGTHNHTESGSGGGGNNGKHSFPHLKTKEIIKVINSLEIKFSESDMREPSPVKMKEVYEAFVELTMDVAVQDLSQPHQSALENLEYSSLYDRALPELAFFHHLQKLMRAAGIKRFSMMDLMDPQPKRVKIILSALINFAKFREERFEKYSELTALADQYTDEKNRLESTHSDVMKNVTRYRQKREDEKPQVEEIEKEVSQLRQDFVDKQREAESSSKELKKIKREAKELVNQIEENKNTIATLEQEVSRLSAQIVPNPERLMKTLEELKRSVETTKENISKAENESLDLGTQKNMILRTRDEVNKCMEMLRDCQQNMEKYSEHMSEIKSIQVSIDNKGNKKNDLETKEMSLKRSIKRSEEKLERLERQIEQKKSTANMGLESAKRERSLIEDQLKQQHQELERNRAAGTERQRRIEELQRQHANDMDTLTSRYMQLENQVKAYHHSLLKAMQG